MMKRKNSVSYDEALLLQDYRKLDELNQGRVQERMAYLLEKQQREKQERQNGFTGW